MEERKDSNSAYSDAAETEVESAKKAARYIGNKIAGKKAKTKKAVEKNLVKTSAPSLEPKTASRQKRKLALTRLKKGKASRFKSERKSSKLSKLLGLAKNQKNPSTKEKGFMEKQENLSTQ